jgi:S-DNA-T family DNA segregation ATPase FtsK/SpoIIIE
MAKKRRKYKKRNDVSYTGPKSRKRSYSYASSRPRKYKKKKKLNIFGFEKLKPEVARGILVVFLFVFFILGILSMINLAGAFGEVFAEILRRIFGLQAYVLPLFVLLLAVSILIGQRKYKDFEIKTSNYFGVFLFLLCLSGFLHLFSPKEMALEIVEQGRGGGYLGFASSYPLQALMGVWGSGVILLSLSVIGLIMSFNVTLAEIVDFLAKVKNRISKLIGFINKKALMEDELKVSGIEASAQAMTKSKDIKVEENDKNKDDSAFPD